MTRNDAPNKYLYQGHRNHQLNPSSSTQALKLPSFQSCATLKSQEEPAAGHEAKHTSPSKLAVAIKCEASNATHKMSSA